MTTGKTIALTRWTFVGKVMSLLFNMLSMLVITFLPRNKCLLISWLQSPSVVIFKVKVKSLSRVRLCDPVDCSLPGSSVHGIPQARILEWVAIPSQDPRGSSPPRDRTWVSCISGRRFNLWATREVVILVLPQIKSDTVSSVSPSICHEVMGLEVMILVFWMLRFKPTFSFS